jgi:Flp pilus assembly protein TadG
MSGSRRHYGGNATIEFTLIGIPLVFVLISTIEMARGMWIYHTLAYAVKEGTRYAVARGENSLTPSTFQNVCNAIAQAGTGLAPHDLTLTFYSATSYSTTPPTGITVTADNCTGTRWPPGYNINDGWPPPTSGFPGCQAGVNCVDNQPGQTISITGQYPFVSALSMFWPGAGSGTTFQPLACQGTGALCLPAASKDLMQF